MAVPANNEPEAMWDDNRPHRSPAGEGEVPADLPEDMMASYHGTRPPSAVDPLSSPTPAATRTPPPNPETAPPPTFLPQGVIEPAVAGTYLLHHELGRGSFGAVWEAIQASLGRRVALKHLHLTASPGTGLGPTGWDTTEHRRRQEQFRQEAKTAAALEHPNILPVHDLVEAAGGTPVMAMKRVEGRSWAGQIAEDFPTLPVEEFLARHIPILMQVTQAVAYAHSRGVVHRDLKPSQVMLGAYGEVLLMDWGMAVVMDPARLGPPWTPESCPLAPTIDRANNPAGTPAFMAPEQTVAETNGLGPWTDVFLLGGMLYVLLTGRAPYQGATVAQAFRLAASAKCLPIEVAVPRRPAPEELAALVAEAMEPRWQDRRLTAPEFLTRLTEFQSGYGRRRSSMGLTDAVSRDLETSAGGYRAFTELMGQVDNARALWPANPAIEPLRQRILRRHCRDAMAEGDLRLARLLAQRLPGDDLERGPLLAEVAALEQARHRRETQRRVAMGAAVLLMLAVLGAGGWALREKARADRQLLETEQARRRAEQSAAEAERTRDLSERERYFASVGFAALFIRDSRMDKALELLLQGTPPGWRDWEWSHLLARLAEDDVILDRGVELRGEAMLGAAWSPDGAVLVTSQRGGQLRWWDGRTGALLLTRRYDLRGGWSLSWDAAGGCLLVLSLDGRGVQLDARTGDPLMEFSHATPGVQPVFRGGGYSPDGQRFATTGSDARLRIYLSETGGVENTVVLDKSTYDAAFSPDGTMVAVGMLGGGGAAVVEVATGRVIHRLAGGHTVYTVRFNSDGTLLALSCADSLVRLVEPATGRNVAELTAPSSALRGMAFTPDDRTLIAGDSTGLIHVWDVASGRRTRTIAGPSQMVKLEMNPRTNTVASISFDEARLWDLDRILMLEEERSPVPAVVPAGADRFRVPSFPFDRDNVWAGYDERWTAGQGRRHLRLAGHDYVLDSFYRPRSGDGRWWVDISPNRRETWASRADGSKPRLRLVEAGAFTGEFSPDSRWFTLLMASGAVIVYDTESWQRVAELPAPEGRRNGHAAWSLDYSPDGTRLVIGWQTGAMAMVTMPRLEIVWQRDQAHAPGRPVVWLAWSPDATRIASASSDATAAVWGAADGTPISRLTGHSSNLITVDWSPDGRRLITSSFDNTVKLWHPADGREILTLYRASSNERLMGAFFPHLGDRAIVLKDSGGLEVLNAVDPGLLPTTLAIDPPEAMRALERWKRGLRLPGAADPIW